MAEHVYMEDPSLICLSISPSSSISLLPTVSSSLFLLLFALQPIHRSNAKIWRLAGRTVPPMTFSSDLLIPRICQEAS